MPRILLLNIVIFVVLFVIFKSLERVHQLILVAYIVLLILINLILLTSTPFYKYKKLNDKYSTQYVNSVISKLKAKSYSSHIGAYLKSSDELIGYWSVYPCFTPYYLLEKMPGYNAISINTLNTPLDNYDIIVKMRIEYLLNNAPFTKFASHYTKPFSENLIDSIKFNFVKQNNIKYLVLSKNAKLPNLFVPNIDTMFVDSISGERFVFLK